ASQSSDVLDGGLTPHPEGRGLRRAVEAALRDADVAPDAIDAIVPLGCGAAAHDRAEAAALRAVFGERLERVPLITTKANVGLCAAATSAIDIAVGALSLHHQTLPAR